MQDKKKREPGPLPDLPPVDPAVLEEAARRFITAKKPPGGWKKPRADKGRADGGCP